MPLLIAFGRENETGPVETWHDTATVIREGLRDFSQAVIMAEKAPGTGEPIPEKVVGVVEDIGRLVDYHEGRGTPRPQSLRDITEIISRTTISSGTFHPTKVLTGVTDPFVQICDTTEGEAWTLAYLIEKVLKIPIKCIPIYTQTLNTTLFRTDL